MCQKTYDIITVDWNPEQTRMWRHYVEKNCPTANVITIPDDRAWYFCWSSAKLNCFRYPFEHPARVIYMDTDTVVSKDLEYLFDKVGDNFFGLTIRHHATHLLYGIANILKIPRKECVYLSTGLIVLNGYPPARLYSGWYGLGLHPEIKRFMSNKTFDEKVFTFWVISDRCMGKIWEIPTSIHGNILGSKIDFEKGTLPDVLHYHNPNRLRNAGFGDLIV